MILAGAVERFVWGKVGIHRPYLEIPPQNKSPSADEVKSAYERILQDIRAYLREMNVSQRLADDMLRFEPEKVHYLMAADLKRYGLAAIDPAEQQTRAAEQQTQAIENEAHDVQEANRLGLDRREYTRRKVIWNELCSSMPDREAVSCKRRIMRTGR
jgi:hypothetical protein